MAKSDIIEDNRKIRRINKELMLENLSLKKEIEDLKDSLTALQEINEFYKNEILELKLKAKDNSAL